MESVSHHSRILAALAALAVCLGGPALVGVQQAGAQEAGAQESTRATVQKRFATKKHHAYAHLSGAAPIRDDFYHSLGAGLDVGYYFSESFGAELRWLWMANWEVDAAADIREETGFIPDARRQNMLLTAGGRYSLGYGKVLVLDDFVVHFDPQLTGGAGVALAEGRVLPTATVGLSVLTHYARGVQAKLDLQMAFQLENRNRGWVASLSFLPMLGVGMSFALPQGGSP